MKKYEEPRMKLHELKTSKIMAASIGRADTNTSKEGKQDLEDFQEVSSTSVWGN